VTKVFFDKTIGEKIALLYREATFVVAIRYYKYKVNLYLLHGQYVEVFFNHKRDIIERIEPMEMTGNRLKFYADQIMLPSSLTYQFNLKPKQ